MPLTTGQKLGPYEIVSPLGAGGMGEVYRARDTKLKREVAIKVLPADVAADHERLARFQREAEVLASLNHPHIAHVYGIEENALVMELVEGEDLSQRIARGPIPIDEALPIARQIAEALEAAHDHGVVHRDLKPANIKVRPDGTVKVLDFGLAKSLDQGSGIGEQGSGSLDNSPTITSPAMTMRGVILGTAAYMSPEQAKGKHVDRRADIWAFGCVLYEMLTGQRTFGGQDVSDTLVSVLRDDPRWTALPPGTPAHIRLLLRRCLQRDPQKRLPHIGAARLELSDSDTGELVKGVDPATSRPRQVAIASALAGAIVAAGIVAFVMRPQPVAQDAVVTFTLELPDGSVFSGGNRTPRFAVSPDGREILYQVDDGTAARLVIRKLDSVEPIDLPGAKTSRGGNEMQQAFWSPDGRYIGYFDEVAHQLKRMDRQFGAVQVIAEVPGNQFGGSWNSANVILMAGLSTGGIRSVPAGGGAMAQVTTVDASRHEASHLWPQFFLDGRHFVYLTSYTDGTPSALFVGSLDGGTPRRLVASNSSANPTLFDYLVFVREATTVAQRVDLSTGTFVGEPVAIADAPSRTAQGRAALSVSKTGVLAIADGSADVDRFETVWVDRNGKALPSMPKSLTSGVRALRLSPNGSLLSYLRGSLQAPGGTVEIWVQDTVRGIESRIGVVPSPAGMSLVFSPDGTEFITRLYDGVVFTLFRQPVFGTDSPQRVFTGENAEALVAYDWSPDRTRLIVSRGSENGNGGIWTVPIDPLEKPARYDSTFVRTGADLSPDGQWLAYTAGADMNSGQIFLQAFPDPRGGKWPVSAIGASHPRWRADGRELYFVADDRLMAVAVSTSPRLEIGVPSVLFDLSSRSPGSGPPGSLYPYDVMPKGDAFVFFATRSTLPDARVKVVTDWMRAAGIKH